MKNFLKGYSSDEIESAKGKIKILEKRRKEFNLLKEKLEKKFGFKIIGYIIDDILDCETYHHVCLMINLAVVNNRFSIKNGDRLKVGIKELFKINNDYDRIDKTVYIGDVMEFDKWYEKYSTKELVDLKKHLSEEDFNLFKKLKIKIKNKIYTEQEFEILDMELIAYYRNEEEMSKEELKESKPLPECVERKDYNNLLEKMNKITNEYNF